MGLTQFELQIEELRGWKKGLLNLKYYKDTSCNNESGVLFAML